jgi:HSP20 family molecular chaperone IbpA
MSDPNSSIRVSVGSSSSSASSSDSPRPAAESESRPSFPPPIDIHDGPEGLTLEADLPGATESNVHVQLEDNVLSLHARIDSPVPESARLIHQEYPVGDYHRSFILSDEVDRERITAELKNGVLRIFLPKADRARARRIEIKS